MAHDVFSVLTYKGWRTILEDGGTQSWRANRREVMKATYVVCARHAHSPHGKEGDEPHKHAFLVGRISDVVDDDGPPPKADDLPPRCKVMFSEYALIDGPLIPFQGRNSIAYWDSLESLGINPDELEWKKVGPEPQTPKVSEVSVVDAAKAMVAEHHGVTPDRVEITIRF